MKPARRCRLVWRRMRRKLDLTGGGTSTDYALARHTKLQETRELANARDRGHLVERVASRMRQEQDRMDYTALVEEAFGRRR